MKFKKYNGKSLKKFYVLVILDWHSDRFVGTQRLKNGWYRKYRIASRKAHEIAIKQRRKNKPEFPNLKWPARIRKKHCKKYQRGQLWV